MENTNLQNQPITNPETLAVDEKKPKKKLSKIERKKMRIITKLINGEINGTEAAKKLNCPLGTIKSRIYNAKKELAEKLSDLL